MQSTAELMSRMPYLQHAVHSWTANNVVNGPALDYLLPVTEEEVLTMIDKMPPKSSPVDFIPTSTIKNCPLTFSAIIARLANLSFSEGIFQPPSNLPR